MAKFVVKVSLAAVIFYLLVLCQGEFVLRGRSRCLRICQRWNGFPEHLNGFPGNVQQTVEAKSVGYVNITAMFHW